MGALEYAGGLSNHGPMAAEALQALGHASLIPAWVDVYAPRLPDREHGAPIAADGQTAALGSGRDGDWIATFGVELERTTWRDVLSRWLPALLPGLFAAATHGALRAAHAVRALEQEETDVRRRELAIGLAYWASRYQRLPGQPGANAQAGRGPAAVLSELPLLGPEQRSPGFFTESVLALDAMPEFAQAIERFDPFAMPVSQAISELCATLAGLYLEHPDARIAYAHGVTAPSALRLLAPYLDADSLAAGLGYALQAAAALHATNGRAPASDEPRGVDAELDALSGRVEEIRYRAACSVEEHAIKLTEACLREDAIRPDRRLRVAAADAATRLGASHGGRGG
jgi:hypothetical protein